MPDQRPTLDYARPRQRLWNLLGVILALAITGAWVCGEIVGMDWIITYRRTELYLGIQRGRIGLEFSTGHWKFYPTLEISGSRWPAHYWSDSQLLRHSRGGVHFAGFEARVGHFIPGKYGNAIPDGFYYGGVVIPLWFPLAVMAFRRIRRVAARKSTTAASDPQQPLNSLPPTT